MQPEVEKRAHFERSSDSGGQRARFAEIYAAYQIDAHLSFSLTDTGTRTIYPANESSRG